ncbi:MAG: EamA family transporter [Acidilobus sp.]|jgi:DME family drug/metabolite transporter|nr:EamA family transporter [Acidilobus sp.]
MRALYAAIASVIPAVISGILTPAALWALAGGVLSLGAGDTMYLASIGLVGVSVAAPVSYTFIIMAEVMALAIGERPTPLLIAGGALVVLGVTLISRGPRGRLRPRGVALALGAAVAWASGWVMIRVADVGGLSPISAAFLRVSVAGLILALVAVARGGGLTKTLTSTARTRLPIVAAVDLAGGSALFALALGLIGVDRSMVIVGSMPLMAQGIAWATGSERPSALEVAGAVLVALAVVLAFM